MTSPEERAVKQAARWKRYRELSRIKKAELCDMLREGGLIASKHPPEKWRKDEVIHSLIDIEEIRAERDRIEAQA